MILRCLSCTIMIVSTGLWRNAASFTLRKGGCAISQRVCLSSSSSASEVKNPSSSFAPWNDPTLKDRVVTKKRNNRTRFRQHVNPLSRRYQQQTELPENWPTTVLDDCANRPLHLDIGSGKGGFLIDLCKTEIENTNFNYLGLEIRPGVAAYAKERVAVHNLEGRLEYLGCNANVDLDRILQLYQDVCDDGMFLQRVTIQYPDPHFKAQHAKRRVVTGDLIDTLAKYMPVDAIVFLQSDIQSVLDDMRIRFRDCPTYFADSVVSGSDYLPDNYLGVPTEREQSVLDKGLPVYRSLFTRTDKTYIPPANDESSESIEM